MVLHQNICNTEVARHQVIEVVLHQVFEVVLLQVIKDEVVLQVNYHQTEVEVNKETYLVKETYLIETDLNK